MPFSLRYCRFSLFLAHRFSNATNPCMLALGIIMLACLASCSPQPADQPPDAAIAADSALMASRIDSALRTPDKADSLLARARQQLQSQPALQDVYRFSYARFLLLTGNLSEAREQIALAMAGFGADSLALGLAKYHNLLAAVEAYDKSQSESVYHFNQAIRLYEMHGDDRQAAIIRFNLANIFFGRRDYETAYQYSHDAKGALEEARDTANLTLCLSVLSIAATNLGRLDEAARHATEALDWAEMHPNLQGTIFSNYAMGEVDMANGSHDDAIERFRQAIELGERHGVMQWLVPIWAALQRACLDAG